MQANHIISRSMTIGFMAIIAVAALSMALAPSPSLFAG